MEQSSRRVVSEFVPNGNALDRKGRLYCVVERIFWDSFGKVDCGREY